MPRLARSRLRAQPATLSNLLDYEIERHFGVFPGVWLSGFATETLSQAQIEPFIGPSLSWRF